MSKSIYHESCRTVMLSVPVFRIRIRMDLLKDMPPGSGFESAWILIKICLLDLDPDPGGKKA